MSPIFEVRVININDIILLKCIKQNNSLSIIKNRGLSYAQIAMSIQRLTRDGYLEYDNDDIIVLTTFGCEIVADYDSKNPDGEQRWIHPQYNKYVKPLDSSVVILPKKKKI